MQIKNLFAQSLSIARECSISLLKACNKIKANIIIANSSSTFKTVGNKGTYGDSTEHGIYISQGNIVPTQKMTSVDKININESKSIQISPDVDDIYCKYITGTSTDDLIFGGESANCGLFYASDSTVTNGGLLDSNNIQLNMVKRFVINSKTELESIQMPSDKSYCIIEIAGWTSGDKFTSLGIKPTNRGAVWYVINRSNMGIDIVDPSSDTLQRIVGLSHMDSGYCYKFLKPAANEAAYSLS